MATSTARPVLVTGASAGIGNHIVRYLAERGQLVYGTVRKDRDAGALRRIDHVIPLKVDVTNPQQIEDAARSVAGLSR